MNVIIVGGGQVGSYIANLLISNHCNVKVIENRAVIFDKLKMILPADSLVFGSGTDPNILEACSIDKADVVVAVTGADETNLVASTIAKFEFDVPRVIARVNNPQNTWLFNTGMGVDASINQADLIAHLVVEEIDLKNMLTLMKIKHGNRSIVQVKVDSQSKAINKAVRDLNIPKSTLLIAVYRGGDAIIPRGDTVILDGDDILAFTDPDTQVLIDEIFTSK